MANTLKDRVATLEASIGPVDPLYAQAFETDAEPVAVAPTMPGPQRLTMLVPFHDSVVNLGQEVAPRGTTTFNGLDTGIAGHTLEHIDFQAIAAPATTVTLGNPMSTAPDLVRDAVPTANYGYGMATADIAYHEAKLQHYLASRDGDVVLRAASDKPAVLQAKAGVTELNAGTELAITARNNIQISAGGWDAPAPARAQDWVTTGYASTSAYVAQAGGVSVGFAAALSGVANTMAPPVKHANDMAPGTAATGLPTSNAVKAAGVIAGLLSGAAYHGITLHGRGDTSIAAGKYAGLWGNACASVVSGLVSGLFGATADVKGFLYAGVWGGEQATLAALGCTSVKATSGNVESYSAKKTHITSAKNIDMQGSQKAQLNAEENAAVFTSRGDAFVLGGKQGMHVTDLGVYVGQLSGNDKCVDAKFETSKPHFCVKTGEVEAHSSDGKHMLRVDKTGTVMMRQGGGFVRVDSGCVLAINGGSGLVSLKG